MPRKQEEGRERQREAGAGNREPAHLDGVFSSCCFTQTRFGFKSSDFWNAARASASLFSFRKLSPSHRYASAFLASSCIAFFKSAIANCVPPPSCVGR